MEVYAKYFRRLLSNNASQVFSTNRAVEPQGSYNLLVNEIKKASRDADSAKKIAETIDISEETLFRDFDLATFLAHFELDPVAKTILAGAFTQVTRPDLRAKGMHYPAID